MTSRYHFRKQTCSFMVNLEMIISAVPCTEFGVSIPPGLAGSSESAIRKGVNDAFVDSGVGPHHFEILEVVEHMEDMPPLGYELCARGACLKALGIEVKG